MGRHKLTINDDYIASKTPNVCTFVHRVYMYASKEFFHDETLLNPSYPNTRPRQIQIIQNIIKQVLNESVPIDELLSGISDDDIVSLSLQNNEYKADNETEGEKEEDNNNNNDEQEEEVVQEEEGFTDIADDIHSQQYNNNDETKKNNQKKEAENVSQDLINSGVISNNGTNVQIMLHSTMQDDLNNTKTMDTMFNDTVVEKDQRNIQRVPIRRNNVISRSSIIKK